MRRIGILYSISMLSAVSCQSLIPYFCCSSIIANAP